MNCLVTCLFVDWTAQEEIDLVRAGSGRDEGDFGLLKVGERAHTVGRLFSCREGLAAAGDYLSERSHVPDTAGVVVAVDSGIDRATLRDAIDMLYGMMGSAQKGRCALA
jgi:aldehyde:ferredoxin oxidoreductase